MGYDTLIVLMESYLIVLVDREAGKLLVVHSANRILVTTLRTCYVVIRKSIDFKQQVRTVHDVEGRTEI